MAIAELKEAITLLRRVPSLWVPGIVGGILAAAVWVSLNMSGTFFASRLLVISLLVLHLFTTGILVIIRDREGTPKTMLAGGIKYYFRVLLPLLVIVFCIMLVLTVVMVTVSLIGNTIDPAILSALAFGFMIPAVVLTFFYDAAAVFEDKKVFESVQRSAQLVMTRINEVIVFLLVGVVMTFLIVFTLMIVWEAFLFDKLEPITRYNETQLQAFTPDLFIGMIGPEGMWITALMLFIGLFLLVPVLYSYKACFFRNLAGNVVITQQPIAGEYDSKGRWYKY
jgi:hypothetical protein